RGNSQEADDGGRVAANALELLGGETDMSSVESLGAWEGGAGRLNQQGLEPVGLIWEVDRPEQACAPRSPSSRPCSRSCEVDLSTTNRCRFCMAVGADCFSLGHRSSKPPRDASVSATPAAMVAVGGLSALCRRASRNINWLWMPPRVSLPLCARFAAK